MATIIKPKRSETSSSAPTTANLAVGEIAINTADQKIYTRDSGNNIVTLAQPGLLNVVEDTTPQLGGSLDTNSNDINFADNDKANFGADSDLQIYHDGSQSIIEDVGTGQLKILAENTLHFGSTTGAETYIRALKNGAIELYYDNSKKIETTTDGTLTCGSSTITDGTVSWPFASKSDNLHIGTDASCSLTTGTNNIAVGCQSLKLNEDGANNIAIGQNSLCCATTPSCNIVIGKNSLCASDECTFVGCWNGSSYPTTTRSTAKNVVIGNNLLTNETMAHNNTVIGHDIATCSATYICTWGCTCTCNGQSAIPYDEKGGNNNTLIGNCISLYSCRVDKSVVVGSCINTDIQSLGATLNSQVFGHNILNCSATSGTCCSQRYGCIRNSFISGTCLFDKHPTSILADNIIIGNGIGSSSCLHACGPISNGSYSCCVSYKDSVILGKCASSWAWWNQCSVTIGSCAGQTHSVSQYDVFIGSSAGTGYLPDSCTQARETYSCQNTAIGSGAMSSMGSYCGTSGADMTICCNVAVGWGALQSVNGCYNTAIGAGSSQLLMAGDSNTTIGHRTGFCLGCAGTTASSNVLIGKNAGCQLTQASNNIVIGTNAQSTTSTTSNEITLGDANITSLRIPGLQSSATDGQVLTYCSTNGNIVLKNSSGCNWDPLVSGALCNIYISNTACSFSSGGLCNTVVGHLAGCSLATSDRNTLIGLCAGMKLTGSLTTNNVAIGNGSLGQVECSSHNTAIGYCVMGGCTPGTGSQNGKGCYNTAIGSRAGFCLASSGNCNILIGRDTAFNLTTGDNNIALGAYAMERATTNGNQVVIGQNAVQYLIGGNNLAIGNYAVRGKSTGDCSAGNNIGIGNGSAAGLTTGSCNIAMGHLSGDVSSGKWNMFLGHTSGYHGTQYVTGCCNVVLGVCAGQSLANNNSGSNNIIIGYNADFSGTMDGTCSNTIIIGNSSHNQLIIPGLSAGQGQTLCFNGSGFVASDSAGVTPWQAVCTSAFTATAGLCYFVNTTSAAITATLPASASLGDEIHFKDYNDTFDTNNLTIGRNSHNIEGSAADLTVATEGAGFTLVYVDSTRGWILKDV